MTDFDAVVTAWNEVGGTPKAQAAIHPSGGVGDEAYERSGAMQAEMIADYIALYLPSIVSPRIVDFGCGDGRVAKHLAETYDDVWGVDASENMLDRLTKRAPGVMPLLSNGLDREMANLSADVIYSLAVFIHHSVEDGRKLMRQLSMALAPGGLLLAQVPVYASIRERGAWCDVTVWDRESFASATRACGLQVVELQAHDHEFSYDNIGDKHRLPHVLRKTL